MKSSSKVSCLIFEGGDTEWMNYEGDAAIEINKWINDREEIKFQINTLLYLLEESEVPDNLMETFGSCCMNLRNLIKE